MTRWGLLICAVLVLWGGLVYTPSQVWRSHEWTYNFDMKTGRGDWSLDPNNRTVYSIPQGNNKSRDSNKTGNSNKRR
jgi:hypothetical protein